jgi:hypothetical protein
MASSAVVDILHQRLHQNQCSSGGLLVKVACRRKLSRGIKNSEWPLQILEMAQWDIFGKCQLAFYRAHTMCQRKKVVGITKWGINFYACGNGLSVAVHLDFQNTNHAG